VQGSVAATRKEQPDYLYRQNLNAKSVIQPPAANADIAARYSSTSEVGNRKEQIRKTLPIKVVSTPE